VLKHTAGRKLDRVAEQAPERAVRMSMLVGASLVLSAFEAVCHFEEPFLTSIGHGATSTLPPA
jgi:hypothetical protein